MKKVFALTLFIPTVKELGFPAPFDKVTFWPVLNGWFGRYIALVGIEISDVVIPTVIILEIAPPSVKPTPTASVGLK